eukprot:TRINITY_DN67804_c9_g1_i1.p1 TRINITY_DN67804_c9_g1~~TRINITY_DN67804_c9_g1_i1.p1  ORF type:complete len:192 (-),score=18.46 TRINITY_DN67804_c9_g1_i1:144-677(-)
MLTAAQLGQVDVVAFLARKYKQEGKPLPTRKSSGVTIDPVLLACQKGHLNVATYLLNTGMGVLDHFDAYVTNTVQSTQQERGYNEFDPEVVLGLIQQSWMPVTALDAGKEFAAYLWASVTQDNFVNFPVVFQFYVKAILWVLGPTLPHDLMVHVLITFLPSEHMISTRSVHIKPQPL